MDFIEIIITHTLHGLVYGMLLFVVAVGLTLIFGMMNVLSIAHAAFYMLGAYFAFSVVQWGGNFWIGLIIAPIMVGIVGYLVERFLLRKVHVYGHADELLLTLGIFYVVTELVKVIWGDFSRPFLSPPLFTGQIEIFGSPISLYGIFIIFSGLCVALVLALVLNKTKIGMIIRSAVSDPQMVTILGINVNKIFLYVFAVSSAFAGLGGVIAGPFLTVYPSMGMDMMIDMFIVIVIGGFGSLSGAFIASILIALLESFGILLIPELALVFKFMLMALVLVVRPTGLFGEKV